MFLQIIFKQKFSVVPGAIVLSIITISFFLYFFEIREQAEDKDCKSGLLNLSTGVGTVIIKILQSSGNFFLSKINFIFFLLKDFFLFLC